MQVILAGVRSESSLQPGQLSQLLTRWQYRSVSISISCPQELSHLPFLLDDLERRVELYQSEIKGMSLITMDMVDAMQVAQVRRGSFRATFERPGCRSGTMASPAPSSKLAVVGRGWARASPQFPPVAQT